MDSARYVDAVRTGAATIAAAGRTNIKARVPSCPEWTLTDLISHVGGVHRWAAGIVRTGQRGQFEGPPDGLGGEQLVQWAEEQAAVLVETLEAADPDADVWTFGRPRTVRFWLRRQGQETTLHAWDAAAALGVAGPLSGDFAADGLDEFLGEMLVRVVAQKPHSWTGETLHFHRTDGEGEWLVRLGPEGQVAVDRTHGKGNAALRGPASDLLLWATNRIDAPNLERFGDQALLHRWTQEITL